MKKISLLLFTILIYSCSSVKFTNDYLTASSLNIKAEFDKEQKKNWHNLDLEKDSIPGMSIERAHTELIKGLKGKKVVVAVIDAGIDINHEDLSEVIWVNKDEIPNNGIDDDKNGYVDDVNGWNFLGDSYNETLEMSRIIRDDLTNYRNFKSAISTVEKKVKESKQSLDFYKKIIDDYKDATKIISDYLGKDDFLQSDILKINSKDSLIQKSKELLSFYNSRDLDLDYLKEGVEYFSDQINYHYNVEFNGRTVVGDDIYDINDINYIKILF